LYYVREGVVNTYATSFIVPVPAHIADLEFMWQALGRRPVRKLGVVVVSCGVRGKTKE
jgi:hypothetical protein